MRVERVENLFGNRQEVEAMYTHILIPTDGSELSNNAIRYGVALAKAVNAKVTGITVTTPFHVIAAMPVRTNSLRKLIDGTKGQSGPKVSRAELQAKKNLPWPPPCVVVER
jgi:nucleotide-binding universal stress UspA family protein